MAEPGAPVDFYFDFSSPYSYLASHRIDGIARKYQRQVQWRPILLGPIFKVTGMQPLAQMPLKGAYMKRDVPRAARFHEIPFAWPDVFPFNTVAPARAFYFLDERNPGLSHRFARAVFEAAFAMGEEVGTPEAVNRIAARLGIDGGELAKATEQQVWKDRLRAEVEQAAKRGVFGAPFFIVDGEPFWGNDRLADVDAWLASGGW